MPTKILVALAMAVLAILFQPIRIFCAPHDSGTGRSSQDTSKDPSKRDVPRKRVRN
jgi:hypothetical protein